jgi:hypothetical protein
MAAYFSIALTTSSLVATHRLDVHLGDGADVVDGDHVGGVRHREQQLAVLEPDGEDDVLAQGRVADHRGGPRVDLVLGEVEERHADLGRQRGDEVLLGDVAPVDQHAAEGAAARAVLLLGAGELLRGDEALVDEDAPEGPHPVAPVRASGGPGWSWTRASTPRSSATRARLTSSRSRTSAATAGTSAGRSSSRGRGRPCLRPRHRRSC